MELIDKSTFACKEIMMVLSMSDAGLVCRIDKIFHRGIITKRVSEPLTTPFILALGLESTVCARNGAMPDPSPVIVSFGDSCDCVGFLTSNVT